MNSDKITMLHGSGGAATGELIQEIFASAFHDDTLDEMEDAAVLTGMSCFLRTGSGIPVEDMSKDISMGNGSIAVTTDSFVVTPVEFPGGDIGRLAVCGTVNDLLMRGAIPQYMTAGWILEVGTPIDKLKRIVTSMAETAGEAGVRLVAGDTKVVEGQGGIYINTTGIGYVPEGIDISAANAVPGDHIIVSGTMGDHHAAILSERMSIENEIVSDAAPLCEMCEKLRGLHVHTLRDVTRGGLATVLKELAVSSGMVFNITEEAIPVSDSVRGFSGLLGLDPLYMGNEGKLVCIVSPEDSDKALAAIRSSSYGSDAALIGEVTSPSEQVGNDDKSSRGKPGSLYLHTSLGGLRSLDVLQGEGLPRIC